MGDFSVVVVRSDFVLVSEKNRMQVQTMEDRICLKHVRFCDKLDGRFCTFVGLHPILVRFRNPMFDAAFGARAHGPWIGLDEGKLLA
jgi:hypothetical protein